MPGRMFLSETSEIVADYFSAADPGFAIEPRHNIAPGQNVAVCDTAQKITEMRWGMIPVGRVNARGRPVMETIVNVRSETIFEKSAFHGVSRCLVPANGWYEWTGEKRSKTPWQISRIDGDLIAFAAVCDCWVAPNGTKLGQVATVTCSPSADVRDIHDRMGVVLGPEDFSTWLNGARKDAASLMRPLDAGTLMVKKAEGVDWSAG